MDYTPDFWFLEKDQPTGRETPSTISTYFTSTTRHNHCKPMTFLFAILALCISLNPVLAASCPYFQMTDLFANYIMGMFGILLVYRLAPRYNALGSALHELYNEYFRSRIWTKGHGWEGTTPDVNPYQPRVVR